MARTPEQKLAKLLRGIFSFLLAGVITILSVAICFVSNFINPESVEKYFNSFEYSCGVRDDISDYAKDIYDKNGLDNSNIDYIFSYDNVKLIVDDYAAHVIADRAGYDEKLYSKHIEDVTDDLRQDIEAQLKANGNDNDIKAIDQIVRSVAKYIEKEINITGIGKLNSVMSIGNKITKVILFVNGALFIFVAGVLLFLGEQRYRSVRAISISFLTSGFYQIFLGLIVIIISRVKRFDIYPNYLFDQLMSYVDNCSQTLMLAGFVLIIISIFFASIAWMQKNK